TLNHSRRKKPYADACLPPRGLRGFHRVLYPQGLQALGDPRVVTILHVLWTEAEEACDPQALQPRKVLGIICVAKEDPFPDLRKLRHKRVLVAAALLSSPRPHFKFWFDGRHSPQQGGHIIIVIGGNACVLRIGGRGGTPPPLGGRLPPGSFGFGPPGARVSSDFGQPVVARVVGALAPTADA
ncbi:MAG: hypothetical protein GY772_19000, partial [bacterium]|nr:hypothetical protein [bacterium]